MGSSDPLGFDKGGNRGERRQGKAADSLLDMSTRLFESTDPARMQVLGNINGVLSGARPENMRVFAPEREAVESQFKNARENLLETIPARGGELNRRLVDLNIGRAQAIGNLEADVRRDAMNKAMQVGFGAAPTALGGLGNAGSIYGQNAALAQQREQAQKQGMGSTIGSIAGIAAMAYCWVAKAIYGETEEFYRARWWIGHMWQGRIGDGTRWLYRQVGPGLAIYVRRHRALRLLLKPLFDIAVRRGRWTVA